MSVKTFKLLLFLPLLAAALPAYAAFTHLINFQARLTDVDGNPVTEERSIVFNLYPAETGGTSLLAETHTVTPDDAGIYTVLLGSVAGALAGIDFNQDLWLEVAVAGETITPRYRLNPSPYAILAGTATAVDYSNIFNNHLADIGLVNSVDNPVDFSQIKNIPSNILFGPGLANNLYAKQNSTTININVSTLNFVTPLSAGSFLNQVTIGVDPCGPVLRDAARK
jgi:hypothetical protein